MYIASILNTIIFIFIYYSHSKYDYHTCPIFSINNLALLEAGIVIGEAFLLEHAAKQHLSSVLVCADNTSHAFQGLLSCALIFCLNTGIRS